MFELIVFIVLSVGLVYLSRASLRVPRSHGFYRFFAFEFFLALVLVNLDHWFHEPFSTRQIVSWILLIVSTALAIHGFYLLRIVGRPDNKRSDDELLIGVEKTTSLVTVGAYRYIRHPIYGSLFYGTWGVFLKDPSWPGFILTIAAVASMVITAKMEEEECLRYFGSSYFEYMKSTKMFVPFLF